HRRETARCRTIGRRDDRQAHVLRAVDRRLCQHPVSKSHSDAGGTCAEDEGGRGEVSGSAVRHVVSATGIVDVPYQRTVAETVDRLEALLKAKGLKIFARIDQAAEAAAVGLDMRATVLVMFGDTKAGTPLMNRYPSLAMDLPLKALVWESADGHVWLSYNSPEFLQQRHRLDSLPFAGLATLLEAATE